MEQNAPEILLAVPLAFQDGLDKYNGVMRFLTERKLTWNIRLDRFTPSIDRPTVGERDGFDGAIIDGAANMNMIRSYVAGTMPIVAIDWRHPEIGRGRRRLVRIDSNAAEIGRIAAETLLGVGRFATFAFLTLADNVSWSAERGKAFSRTLKAKGITTDTLSPTTPLEPQLRRLVKPAAVFAANDIIGARVLRAAKREGIAVPEDLSVLGVDDEQFTCLHTDPPLASIQPDFEQAGYLAAAALAGLLGKRNVKAVKSYRIRGISPRRSMEPARSAGRLVQRAMELIRDTRLAPGKIDELAKQLGVSRRLLDLRFRQIMSCSVLDAVQAERMKHVRSLLDTTKLTISEICATSGFSSGTYLQRLFKRRFGQTMGEYRAQSASAS